MFREAARALDHICMGYIFDLSPAITVSLGTGVKVSAYYPSVLMRGALRKLTGLNALSNIFGV